MWKLKTSKDDLGRCVWYFDPNESEALSEEQSRFFDSFDKKINRNSGDKIYRHIATKKFTGVKRICPLTNSPKTELATKALESAFNGFCYYEKLQTDSGFWPGDYGGPMFLLPNFIIVFNITRTPIETRKKELMTQYIKNHQNEDGGWGTHIQSENSTMFGSVMNYIAARLLGTLLTKNPKLT